MINKIKSGLIALVASSAIAFSGCANQQPVRPYLSADIGSDIAIYKVKKFENKRLETTPAHPDDSFSGETLADLEGKSSFVLSPTVGADLGLEYRRFKLEIGSDVRFNGFSRAYRSGICETKQQIFDSRPKSNGSFVYSQIYPDWFSFVPHVRISKKLNNRLELGFEVGFPYTGWTFESGHDRWSKFERVQKEESKANFGTRYTGSLKWKGKKNSSAFISIFRENYEPDFKGKSEIEGWGAFVGFEKRF